MIKFTEDFYTAIEKVKSKVLAKDLVYSKEEFLHLAYAYKEMNSVLFNRKSELKKGCGGCLKTAVKVLGNFINQNYVEPKEGKAKVNRVVVGTSISDLLERGEATLEPVRIDISSSEVLDKAIQPFIEGLQTRKEIVSNQSEYDSMKYPALLKLANEKGFNGERRTRQDLMEFLNN